MSNNIIIYSYNLLSLFSLIFTAFSFTLKRYFSTKVEASILGNFFYSRNKVTNLKLLEISMKLKIERGKSNLSHKCDNRLTTLFTL